MCVCLGGEGQGVSPSPCHLLLEEAASRAHHQGVGTQGRGGPYAPEQVGVIDKLTEIIAAGEVRTVQGVEGVHSVGTESRGLLTNIIQLYEGTLHFLLLLSRDGTVTERVTQLLED